MTDITMLRLKLESGARFELPAAAISLVEQMAEGGGCAVVFDLGDGVEDARLSDEYGYVKKQVLAARALGNPLEVTIVNDQGRKGKVLLSRDRIIARREVLDGQAGVNTLLTIQQGVGAFKLQVTDTFDQMDGVESQPRPAAKRPRRGA